MRDNPLSSDDSNGAMNEAFRVLRTNLQFADLDARRQTILVTSSVPDEGKTFVATNLAISLAKAGRSVLLFDADMRNPNVGKLLGLENTVGMITVLLGRASLEPISWYWARCCRRRVTPGPPASDGTRWRPR